MIVTARNLIYKNKLGDIISVANEKSLPSNEVEWMFLLKKAKDLGLSIDDIKKFIVENKPISK